ncbi:hypothetical protein D0B32_31500 [Paraburkholderia sp. DHOC27]|nr:hypothetical protein D0B32_31500 [Paraburkholderia sp. DHOC27]
MGNRVELVTARLQLRRTRPGDAPALFNNYTGDPHCARFLQRRPHADVAHTQAMLQVSCTA